jgi:hypothetical protein
MVAPARNRVAAAAAMAAPDLEVIFMFILQQLYRCIARERDRFGSRVHLVRATLPICFGYTASLIIFNHRP